MQEIDSGLFNQISLVRLLNTWSPVFYFRGSFEELETLLMGHLDVAQSLTDKEEKGMFFVWLGMCLWGRARFEESYAYLHQALKLGEESGSKRVIGYVGAWLPWPCVELGLFEEALEHADRAREMADHFEADGYPYYLSLDSSAFVYFAAGRPKKIQELGEALLEYGSRKSSIRAITWGYFVKGWGSMAAGDFTSAISFNEKAIRSSRDPFYTQFPKLSLGMSLVSNEEFEKAEEPLRDVSEHAQEHGSEILGLAAEAFLGVIAIQAGNFKGGMAMLERAGNHFRQHGSLWRTAFIDLIMGEVYLNLYMNRRSPISLPVLLQNLTFLIRNVPRAGHLAEHFYLKTIETSERIESIGFQGQAHLGLAKLYHSKRQYARSTQSMQTAIDLFESCAADAYLEQARQCLRDWRA
jgi:tetratricopeptide (TPR) repeat protein